MLARRSLIRAMAFGLPTLVLLTACKNRKRDEYTSSESDEYSRRQEPRDGSNDGGGGSGGGGNGGY